MKDLLKKNSIFLNDKQIGNLKSIISFDAIDKFIPLIKTIDKIPRVNATFVVDDLTWFILCREAAKKRVPPKIFIREIISTEIARRDEDYKLIYPIIKALNV